MKGKRVRRGESAYLAIRPPDIDDEKVFARCLVGIPCGQLVDTYRARLGCWLAVHLLPVGLVDWVLFRLRHFSCSLFVAGGSRREGGRHTSDDVCTWTKHERVQFQIPDLPAPEFREKVPMGLDEMVGLTGQDTR